MKRFIVKGHVKYEGKLYKTGQVVEVNEKDVPEFQKHGWLMTEKPATSMKEVVVQPEPAKQEEVIEQQEPQQEPENIYVPESGTLAMQVADFDIMSVAQLKQELKTRGIAFKSTHTKPQLLELLRNSDEG